MIRWRILGFSVLLFFTHATCQTTSSTNESSVNTTTPYIQLSSNTDSLTPQNSLVPLNSSRSEVTTNVSAQSTSKTQDKSPSVDPQTQNQTTEVPAAAEKTTQAQDAQHSRISTQRDPLNVNPSQLNNAPVQPLPDQNQSGISQPLQPVSAAGNPVPSGSELQQSSLNQQPNNPPPIQQQTQYFPSGNQAAQQIQPNSQTDFRNQQPVYQPGFQQPTQQFAGNQLSPEQIASNGQQPDQQLTDQQSTSTSDQSSTAMNSMSPSPIPDEYGMTMTCPTPVDIPGASYRIFGSFVVYQCRPGYLEARYVSMCLPNSTWMPPNITCKPKDCGNTIPVVEGSTSRVTSTLFGSTVMYKCNEVEGYSYVSGTTTSTCGADGLWSDVNLKCGRVTYIQEPQNNPTSTLVQDLGSFITTAESASNKMSASDLLSAIKRIITGQASSPPEATSRTPTPTSNPPTNPPGFFPQGGNPYAYPGPNQQYPGPNQGNGYYGPGPYPPPQYMGQQYPNMPPGPQMQFPYHQQQFQHPQSFMPNGYPQSPFPPPYNHQFFSQHQQHHPNQQQPGMNMQSQNQNQQQYPNRNSSPQQNQPSASNNEASSNVRETVLAPSPTYQPQSNQQQQQSSSSQQQSSLQTNQGPSNLPQPTTATSLSTQQAEAMATQNTPQQSQPVSDIELKYKQAQQELQQMQQQMQQMKLQQMQQQMQLQMQLNKDQVAPVNDQTPSNVPAISQPIDQTQLNTAQNANNRPPPPMRTQPPPPPPATRAPPPPPQPPQQPSITAAQDNMMRQILGPQYDTMTPQMKAMLLGTDNASPQTPQQSQQSSATDPLAALLGASGLGGAGGMFGMGGTPNNTAAANDPFAALGLGGMGMGGMGMGMGMMDPEMMAEMHEQRMTAALLAGKNPFANTGMGGNAMAGLAGGMGGGKAGANDPLAALLGGNMAGVGNPLASMMSGGHPAAGVVNTEQKNPQQQQQVDPLAALLGGMSTPMQSNPGSSRKWNPSVAPRSYMGDRGATGGSNPVPGTQGSVTGGQNTANNGLSAETMNMMRSLGLV